MCLYKETYCKELAPAAGGWQVCNPQGRQAGRGAGGGPCLWRPRPPFPGNLGSGSPGPSRPPAREGPPAGRGRPAQTSTAHSRDIPAATPRAVLGYRPGSGADKLTHDTVTGARVTHRPEQFQGLGAGRGGGPGAGAAARPSPPPRGSGRGCGRGRCARPGRLARPLPSSPPPTPPPLAGSFVGVHRGDSGGPGETRSGDVVAVADGGASLPASDPPRPSGLFPVLACVGFSGAPTALRDGGLKTRCHPTTREAGSLRPLASVRRWPPSPGVPPAPRPGSVLGVCPALLS